MGIYSSAARFMPVPRQVGTQSQNFTNIQDNLIMNKLLTDAALCHERQLHIGEPHIVYVSWHRLPGKQNTIANLGCCPDQAL